MKTGLQLKLGTGLTLTPQLRQAIRLLQLSAVELETEVTEALEGNPLLERSEDAGFEEPIIGAASAGSTSEQRDDSAGKEQGEQDDAGEETGFDDRFDGYDGMDEADEWRGQRVAGDEDDGGSRQTAAADSLSDHLLWQLRLHHLGERDVRIGEVLIDGISADGYWLGNFEDVRSALSDLKIDDAEIDTVLQVIQHFDPIGVGARGLEECLRIQLGTLSADTPALTIALQLCGHLDSIAKGAARVAEKLGCDEAQAAQAMALVRSLEPKPGRRFDAEETQYVQPDLIAFRHNGRWQVRLAAHAQPKLRINRGYQAMIGRGKGETDTYLRGHLQEARWLIKSLESRADTLLRVAQVILKQQSGFLDHGPEAMRPLTLKQVADALGMHESTVSRATARKYLRCPRGTLELKSFFSASLDTDTGGSTSATAIQALIRRLIDGEDPRRPHSDAKLTELLQNEGIRVARRTVAKYREGMNIASSGDRQRA